MKTANKKEVEHTPTPWETDWSGQIRGGSEEFHIAELGPNNPDAEFIVRAVNSFEGMLTTLKNTLQDIKTGDIDSLTIQRLETIIAQAEGK